VSSLLPILISILPVFLFLGALVVIDSYKLVPLRAVLIAVAAGIAAGLASYLVNIRLQPLLALDLVPYSRYVAPLVEESLKATYIIYLMSRNRVGFVVDAAILGFGIGTGFAFLENLYYLSVTPEASIWSWIVRGFGTAVMHGGCTAIFAMLARTLHNRATDFRPTLLLPSLAAAVALHSAYNHFLLKPLVATGLIILVFPYVSSWIFQRSERDTREWIGTGFDLDQELLDAVHSGRFAGTPAGQYLATLRRQFPPEAIVDMLCLLRLRAELGIRAKGVLLAREVGLETTPDPSVPAKFEELRYLERSIGRSGMRALRPFLATSTRDLWQFNMIDEAQG
jgi:RsiW-degrading membrane proteinase PrsW (M82 family)